MTFDQELAAKGLIRGYKTELFQNPDGTFATINRQVIVPRQQDEPKTVTKRKVGIRQPRSNNSLKPKAIEMFNEGMTVKSVALELGITYANANYYKRFASK